MTPSKSFPEHQNPLFAWAELFLEKSRMSNQMLSRISLNLIPIGFETRILEQRVGGFGFQTNARLIEKKTSSQLPMLSATWCVGWKPQQCSIASWVRGWQAQIEIEKCVAYSFVKVVLKVVLRHFADKHIAEKKLPLSRPPLGPHIRQPALGTSIEALVRMVTIFRFFCVATSQN